MIPGGKSPPDEETQKNYIKYMMETINNSISVNDEVVYFDIKHQLHNVKNGYAYQKKGNENTKCIRSNSGRRRINILGTVNAVTKEVFTIVSESNCNKELILLFITELRKKYTNSKTIHIFIDNASYNRSYDVQDYADELNIVLHYLPSYCPNLNIIERLWRLFIKEAIENNYHFYYDDFLNYVCDYLSEINNIENHEKLLNLLSLNFEVINDDLSSKNM